MDTFMVSEGISNYVLKHYEAALLRWNAGSTLDANEWERTLCWAGMLHWNFFVWGPKKALAETFPGKPSFREIIISLRDENLHCIANSFEYILSQFSCFPDSFSEISAEDMQLLDFPKRTDAPICDDLYATTIKEPDHRADIYHRYRSLIGSAARYEIFRFLTSLENISPELSFNLEDHIDNT